jgi:hypothetical protein
MSPWPLVFGRLRSFWNILVYASAISTYLLDFGRLRSSIVILWSQWAIVELNLPTALNGLAFGLSKADLSLLEIST